MSGRPRKLTQRQSIDICSRDDKLAANYLAFSKFASIRIWLRLYESMP
jgi:hypothetical protein